MEDQYTSIQYDDSTWSYYEASRNHRESLLDRVVTKIEVSEGEHALRFTFDDGTSVIWDTEGDCCSESWWADGYSVQSLIGSVIFDVHRIELEPLDYSRTREEVDEAYGYEIVHSKGKTTFVFRNSSNGYYGGWSSVAPGDSDDKWHNSLIWREITGSDWRA